MGGGKIVKNNLLIGTAFLSLALGAASCTNESEQLTDSRTAPMSVQVANHIASRGLITTGTLPADDYGIGVTLVNKSDKAPYDGQTDYANNQWKTANGTTWDIVEAANPNLTGTEGVAVAYYPYSSTVTSYEAIPVESASQTDYMYSGWSNDLTNASPEATFTMKHALAAVRVKLVASANYTGDKSASAVTISSDGFMATASLDASTGILSSKDGAGAEHSQENLELTLDATGKDVDFLVIPADEEDDINFIATIGGKQYAATVTPGEALAQGLIHTYTLTLSAAGMKVSTVEVTPWGDGQTGSSELKPVGPWDYIANGVYAVSADGKPVDYTTAEANSTCIGVALITDNQRIMIAKNDAKDDTYFNYYWSKNLYAKSVLENRATTDKTTIKADFNGKTNTENIIAAYNEHGVSMDAKDMCSILTAYNNTNNQNNEGYTDWYIPAAGQLFEIYSNRADIFSALTNIGGTKMNTTNSYWSSSESDNLLGWKVVFNANTDLGDTYKNNSGYLRFIRDL